jgi:hypothetical protein
VPQAENVFRRAAAPVEQHNGQRSLMERRAELQHLCVAVRI